MKLQKTMIKVLAKIHSQKTQVLMYSNLKNTFSEMGDEEEDDEEEDAENAVNMNLFNSICNQ